MRLKDTIKICSAHQDYPVPLIQTMIFSGAEYWCPYCDIQESILGADKDVPFSEELMLRGEMFHKHTALYRRAVGRRNAKSFMFEDKRITFDDLPDAEKDKDAQIILDYLYEQKVEQAYQPKDCELELSHIPKRVLDELIQDKKHLKGVVNGFIVRIAFNTQRVYLVLADQAETYRHLRIRRIDNEPIHNYMHLQEIKSMLWGTDTQAVEVYPKHQDFVNGSNTYHLWTWLGIELPNLKELYEY